MDDWANAFWGLFVVVSLGGFVLFTAILLFVIKTLRKTASKRTETLEWMGVSNSRVVGILNILIGLVIIPVPLIQILFVLPKLNRLYKDMNLTNQPNLMLSYGLFGIIVTISLLNIILGVKNLTSKTAKHLRTSACVLIGTLAFGVVLSIIIHFSFLIPIYNLGSNVDFNQNRKTVLPVTILETSYGIDDGTPKPTYPPTLEANISYALAEKLSAYGAGGVVVLGPKGWTGKGSVGANGNTYINLYPKGGDNQRIDIFIASPGLGSGLLEAAPYSIWLQNYGKYLGMEYIPPLKPGLKVSNVSDHIERYKFNDLEAGRETQGIIYSDFKDHIKDWIYRYFRMEIVVNPDLEDTVETILNDFVNRQIEKIQKK